MSNRQIVVIGSGFAGLSAATYLADRLSDWTVILLEKNDSPGGRARQFKAEGFTFDMGPSWYWMPDVFEKYFKQFDRKPSDYYELVRLDPSYRVIFGQDDVIEIPANYEQLKGIFEKIEPGAARKLDKFVAQAKDSYEIGMDEMVHRPGNSVFEFASTKTLFSAFKLNIFQSMAKMVRGFFKNEKIIKIVEFPVIFLGETAENIPAFYNLMNYADIALGTWYPKGGMFEIIRAMVKLAEEKGVKIRYSSEVKGIEVENGKVNKVHLKSGEIVQADILVASADYHHVDKDLLHPSVSNYDEEYWNSRVLAPSSLLFYLGVTKRLKNLRHHNLFFDVPFEPHTDAIFRNPRWPEKPLFYVCVPSITDPTVAPEGMENLFILIPLAPGLEDTDDHRDRYYDIVMERLERITKQEIKSHVVYKRSYAHRDFMADYHAYKGNAYGLANTIKQTAIFKPKLKNAHVSNLYYTGQLTVPGPGIPPCLISGTVVAKEVISDHKLLKKGWFF